MLRVKLKSLFDDFEKAREEISEQVKPANWKESDGMKEWDKKFRPVMQKWLVEEIELETKIFNQEECADLISSNPDLSGSAIDLIVSGLLHE
jgi:molecular chaperone GrpE (heat shock protein)